MFHNFVQIYLVMSEQNYDKERAEHGNGSHDEYRMVGLVLPEHVRRDRHWNGEGHGAGRDQAEINKGYSHYQYNSIESIPIFLLNREAILI